MIAAYYFEIADYPDCDILQLGNNEFTLLTMSGKEDNHEIHDDYYSY